MSNAKKATQTMSLSAAFQNHACFVCCVNAIRAVQTGEEPENINESVTLCPVPVPIGMANGQAGMELFPLPVCLNHLAIGAPASRLVVPS
jgi:hypothetical protein